MRLSLLGLLALFVFATAANAAPICQAGEVPYFVCKFQGKSATLCGSDNTQSRKSNLQYRLVKQGHIEMQFPKSPQAPNHLFLQSSILLAHGGEKRVSFSVGQYKYILYETWDTHSPGYGGIYVLRQGKLLQQYQCDDYANPNASLVESLPQELLQEETYLEF